MTYPDREPRIDYRLALFAVVLFLLIYVAFAAEASFRNKTCVSAMTQELGQPPVTAPTVCR